MPRVAGRAGICLLASCLAVPACAPAPAAPAQGAGDTIVLLSARGFDGSDRVARQLAAMTSASDVLGPARFVLLEAPDGDLERLAEPLHGLQEVRAVVALVGDLSVLDGLDPSIRDRGSEQLTHRTLRAGLLEDAVSALQAGSARIGAPLVLATAPVGMQGRIEVPELLEVADRLRARHAVLDAGAHFGALEPTLLFSNGIDRLDSFGHDELARALYLAFCEDPGPVPPRDAVERAARSEARALHAFSQGDFESFANETTLALTDEAPTPRHAMRRAAIAAAMAGPDAGVDALSGSDPGPTSVPALALWRALRDEPHDAPPPDDPFEARLVAAIRAISSSEPSAESLASALVDEAPHRLEAWIVFHLANERSPVRTDVRAEARRNLAHYPRSAVADRLTRRLLDAWPATLTSLPAVYLASRPFAVLQPTGPILEAARRRARFGYTSEAYVLMRTEMEDDRLPPSWIEARDGWEPR